MLTALLDQDVALLGWQVDPDIGRHPRCCALCRQVEQNDVLGNNNHYPMMGERAGQCVAQMLTRNHVTFGVARVEKGIDCAAAELVRYVDRAAQLWGHRSDIDWLDEARQIASRALSPVVAPEHHAVGVTDQMDLFEVLA